MRRIGAMFCAAVLLTTACGDSATTTTTTAATTTTIATTTTTTAPATTTTAAAMHQVSPVFATLGASYHTTGTFDAAVLGVEPGAVLAEWYTSGGFYVVLFTGLDLNASGPLCPGASIQPSGAGGAFDFIANAATPGADCSSFPSLSTDPDVRALVCNGTLAFRTAIPAETKGTLYASLEKADSGGIIGVSSVTSTDAGEVPEIDASTLEC